MIIKLHGLHVGLLMQAVINLQWRGGGVGGNISGVKTLVT